MTDHQHAVNEIRDAIKSEFIIVVWYRSPKGREIKREYCEADVLDAIRVMYEPEATPIASLIKPVHVGTTPESEEHMGGYAE